MNTFFCAQESRQAGEDPIGSANYSHFCVLIECQPPWASEALDSKPIPSTLRVLQEEVLSRGIYVDFLLMYSEKIKQENSVRCIIFRKQDGFSTGYSKQEFLVPDIGDVAAIVKSILFDNKLIHQNIEIFTRDILVCVHGSQDRCCAKYGNPFYREALRTVANLSLENIRIWQVSHFGGHRFAPTAIDFPEGRYYARLDQSSFTSILTKVGDINCLKNIYRGWGILPYPAQALEREMIFRYGWDWFNYQVEFQIIEQNEDATHSCIKLNFEKPDGSLLSVQADIFEDEAKALYLIGDCNGKMAEKTSQYSVKNIVHT
jgi:hypothetical protein